ncbi:MAG: SWF/SNF helicase family protein, partial [Clostridia bacterium]|nr:SWF/SNF helicase family protein [Clostridia bacterium]
IDVKNSSKAKRLVEIVNQAKLEKRKIIVFSFFLNTLNKVCKMFKNSYYGPITGSVDPKDRQKIIDDFSKGKDGSVLVAQIQAGGTGVNIQSASCVVLCEPQLKPSTENQAISRAYRMGQVRNVQVFKLLCEGCIDEKIVEILKTKDTIFENFADKSTMGEKGIEITKKMTESIIKQEKERMGIKD